VEQQLVGHLNTRTVPRFCREIKESIMTKLTTERWHMIESLAFVTPGPDGSFFARFLQNRGKLVPNCVKSVERI